MIYKNAGMKLVCIDGLKQGTAIFLRIDNNELIKAVNCSWNGENVTWGHGYYLHDVRMYLDYGKINSH